MNLKLLQLCFQVWDNRRFCHIIYSRQITILKTLKPKITIDAKKQALCFEEPPFNEIFIQQVVLSKVFSKNVFEYSASVYLVGLDFNKQHFLV